MSLALASKKVLITGIDSFTGDHLTKHLVSLGYDVYGTSIFNEGKKRYKVDLTQKEQIEKMFDGFFPEYIIHLAGISFTAHEDKAAFYRVNTIGTENLLSILVEKNLKPKKTILASSATVYGNQKEFVLKEEMIPQPVNHYGISKLSMEYIARTFFDKLDIIITRPFNYTGEGQAEHFLIPKIVKHFKEKKDVIELGNIHVKREFNDVLDVVNLYEKLLISKASSKIVNLCSSNPIALLDIIEIMKKIADHDIKIEINPEFVRKNEIETLCGSKNNLFDIIEPIKFISTEDTLLKMYNA